MTRFLIVCTFVLSVGFVSGCGGSTEPQVVEQEEISIEEQARLDEQYEQEMEGEGEQGDE